MSVADRKSAVQVSGVSISRMARLFGAAIGFALLALGAIATFDVFDTDVSDVGVGGFFVLALVLLIFGISGKLPTKVTFGKDQAIDWEDAAKAVTEKNQDQVQEALQDVAPEYEDDLAATADPVKVRELLTDYTKKVKARVQPPASSDVI